MPTWRTLHGISAEPVSSGDEGELRPLPGVGYAVLTRDSYTPTHQIAATRIDFDIDEDGNYSPELWANDEGAVPNEWRIHLPSQAPFYIVVPADYLPGETLEVSALREIWAGPSDPNFGALANFVLDEIIANDVADHAYTDQQIEAATLEFSTGLNALDADLQDEAQARAAGDAEEADARATAVASLQAVDEALAEAISSGLLNVARLDSETVQTFEEDVEARLRDLDDVDPREFDIAGDGVTNDTDAWHDAMEQLAAADPVRMTLRGPSLVSEPIEFTADGSAILGRPGSGLFGTDPEMGTLTAVLILMGEDQVVHDIIIDGGATGVTTNLPARSSGFLVHPDARRAALRGLRVRNCAKNGMAVLGEGHFLWDLRVYDNVRSNIAFGQNALGAHVTRNIHGSLLAAWGSRMQSNFEVNDGCHQIEVVGFYSGLTMTFGVDITDHDASDLSNSDILFAAGIIDVASGSAVTVDGRSCVRIQTTHASNTHERITFRDIMALGGHRQNFWVRGAVKDLTLDNFRGDGAALEGFLMRKNNAGYGAENVRLVNGTRFVGSGSHGISISGADGVEVDASVAENAGSGMWFDNVPNLNLAKVNVKDVGGDCITLLASEGVALPGFKLLGGSLEGSDGLGLRYSGAYSADAIIGDVLFKDNALGEVGGDPLPSQFVTRCKPVSVNVPEDAAWVHEIPADPYDGQSMYSRQDGKRYWWNDDTSQWETFGGTAYGAVLRDAAALWEAVHYWGGPLWKDLLGGHDATLTGGRHLAPYAPGRASLYLPGGNTANYASVPSHADLSPGSAVLDVIVEVVEWYGLTGGATTCGLVIHGVSTVTGAYQFSVRNTGVFRLRARDSAGNSLVFHDSVFVLEAGVQRTLLRARLDPATGIATYYTSHDRLTWEVDSTSTQAMAGGAFHADVQGIGIGANANGATAVVQVQIGRVTVLHNDVAAADLDFTDPASYNATHTVHTAETGQAVGLNRSTTGEKLTVVDEAGMLSDGASYDEAADAATLDFGSGDFTLAFKFRHFHPSPASEEVLWAKKAGLTAASPGYALSVTGGVAKFYMADGSAQVTADSPALTAGADHKVVVQRTGGFLTVHLEGVAGTPVDSTGVGSISNSEVLRGGRLSGAGTSYASAWITRRAAFAEAVDVATLTAEMAA
jgi:hypothetical protein